MLALKRSSGAYVANNILEHVWRQPRTKYGMKQGRLGNHCYHYTSRPNHRAPTLSGSSMLRNSTVCWNRENEVQDHSYWPR